MMMNIQNSKPNKQIMKAQQAGQDTQTARAPYLKR